MSLKELLGEKVIDNTGKETSISEIASKKIVCLYFSAHWCPPCRQFTPILAKTYQDLVKKGESVEIVFISSDKDQKSWEGYFESHPWKAIPYSDRERKQNLAQKFEIAGIPSLIVLNGEGKFLSEDGREIIFEDQSGASLMKLK